MDVILDNESLAGQTGWKCESLEICSEMSGLYGDIVKMGINFGIRGTCNFVNSGLDNFPQ